MKFFPLFWIVLLGHVLTSSCTITGLIVGDVVHNGVKPTTMVLADKSLDLRKGDRIRIYLKPNVPIRIKSEDHWKEKVDTIFDQRIKGSFLSLENQDSYSFLLIKRRQKVHQINTQHITGIVLLITDGQRKGLLAGILADIAFWSIGSYCYGRC